ncbi:hypothetical protein AB1286_04490 [Trinickia sp. NRRL B-1857]|uniref:hypothetical protein n=1 Tax=Trinickia sp. NRRL B-1857 TaxID=3162879 RepID=UPI003D2B71F3
MSDPLISRVMKASYDARGFITVRWITSDEDRATGFVLSVQGVRIGERSIGSFYVEDGASRVAGFPYTFSSGFDYSISVTPYRGDTMLASSPWFPISAQDEPALPGLTFVERLPFTPLLLDVGYNPVKVRLVSADGTPMRNQAVGWSVPAEYPSVRLESDSVTYTDDDGVAVKRIRVGASPKLPDFLTVSAWWAAPHPNDPREVPRHVSTLYACVRPRVASSFVQKFAHPLLQTSQPSSDQFIVSTTTILDEQSRPIRGLRFAWRMEPNAATLARERTLLGTLKPLEWVSTPSYEAGYPASTNDFGQATILFANAKTTIMTFAPALNSTEFQNQVVFTAVDLGLGDDGSLGLPLVGNVLDLDKYPDTVPVTLPVSARQPSKVAIWLNEDIATIVYRQGSPLNGDPIEIPSWRFVSGDTFNAAGCVRGDSYGNGEDSRLVYFKVEGRARIPAPAQGGTLPPPALVQGGVRVIDDSTISGGLQIRVPPYQGIEAGQRVTLNVFVSGYYQGTQFPKVEFPIVKYNVGAADLTTGFILVLNEDDLTGFGTGPAGQTGEFVAQYTVSRSKDGSPASLFSRVFSLPIVTTVPDRPSDWIALQFDPSRVGSDEDAVSE